MHFWSLKLIFMHCLHFYVFSLYPFTFCKRTQKPQMDGQSKWGGPVISFNVSQYRSHFDKVKSFLTHCRGQFSRGLHRGNATATGFPSPAGASADCGCWCRGWGQSLRCTWCTSWGPADGGRCTSAGHCLRASVDRLTRGRLRQRPSPGCPQWQWVPSPRPPAAGGWGWLWGRSSRGQGGPSLSCRGRVLSRVRARTLVECQLCSSPRWGVLCLSEVWLCLPCKRSKNKSQFKCL